MARMKAKQTISTKSKTKIKTNKRATKTKVKKSSNKRGNPNRCPVCGRFI